MVKLGSLYRGPQDAPLSHRIRNIPTAPNLPPNSSNFNANSSINARYLNSSREQLSKYQRNEVQVSTIEVRLYNKKYAPNKFFLKCYLYIYVCFVFILLNIEKHAA